MSGAWVAEAAREHGDRAAIRFDGRSISWRELADEAAALAGALATHGVGRGDIVAVHLAPQPRFVALLHAAQMLGAALLPLNLRLAPPELERVLSHARPRLVVDDGRAPVAGEWPRVHAFDDLTSAPRSFAAPAIIDPEAPLAIVYTSGTTSAPKGVVLTNANFAASAAASRERLCHGAGDTWLAAMPMFHVGGLAILVRSVLEGSVVALEGAFDETRAADVLARGEATMVSLVPTMLARVLDRGIEASPRVRCVLVGGAALSPSLGRRALDMGLPVSATYGMTESCSQIATSEPGSDDAAHGLVGRALDGTEIRIDGADAEGRGEILVRGPSVMRGYLRNDEADARALAGGWLRTGDLGRLDERGHLAVAGRRDDLIVTGGENVVPLEVERVLDAHPDVAESLVVGVPDAEWGQRLVAVVVTHEGRHLEPDALQSWCREHLASYKVPREVRHVDALPRGATGKTLRQV